jgi:hypothetical protein
MKKSSFNNHLSEADLYGYSKWLAAHLGYSFIPRSLRGFQHGWIWWDPADANIQQGMGLDPNLDSFWGVLTQSEKVSEELRRRGIYSQPCGLPFLNYYKHCGLQGSFKHLRKGSILYVPTHSNPWNNRSNDVEDAACRFARHYPNSGVMLGWNDRHMASRLSGIFESVEIGAGALESESFLRMLNIFERYDYMITDTMGSHVCYGLACGMKVGVHYGLHCRSKDGKEYVQNIDYQKFKKSDDFDRQRHVYTPEYLDNKFPGIVIDSGIPNYSKMPSDIVYERPAVIASQLGWDMTYESELVKQKKADAEADMARMQSVFSVKPAVAAMHA